MKMKSNALTLLSSLTSVVLILMSTTSVASNSCRGVFGVSRFQWAPIEMSVPWSVHSLTGIARWNEDSGMLVVLERETSATIAVFTRHGDEIKELKRNSYYHDYEADPADLRKIMRTRAELQLEATKIRYDEIRLVGSMYYSYKSRWDPNTQTLSIIDPANQVAGIYAKEGGEVKVIQKLQDWNIVEGELTRLMRKPAPLPFVELPNSYGAYVNVVSPKGTVRINARYSFPNNSLYLTDPATRAVWSFVKEGDVIREMRRDPAFENWTISEANLRALMVNKLEAEPEYTYGQISAVDSGHTKKFSYKTKLDSLNGILYVFNSLDQVAAIYANEGGKLIQKQGLGDGRIIDRKTVESLLNAKL